MKIRYTVLEEDDKLEERYGPVTTIWEHSDSLNYAAGDCADHFWSHHEGYENCWPLTFVLFDADDRELGRFTVEMEMEPTFRGSVLEVKTKKGGER